MAINITDADRMEMHRLGKEALDREGVIGARYMARAADFMLIAGPEEKLALKAELMVGFTLAAFYSEKRAGSALAYLTYRLNRGELTR